MSEKDKLKGPKLYAEKGIVVTACGEPIRTSEVVHVGSSAECLYVTFRGQAHGTLIHCESPEQAEETQRLIVESMLWGDGPEDPHITDESEHKKLRISWTEIQERLNKHIHTVGPHVYPVPEVTAPQPEIPFLSPYMCRFASNKIEPTGDE